MGITGLLPVLKSIQTTRKLSNFAGQMVAVGRYVWLHRGVYHCSVELATGKETHKCVADTLCLLGTNTAQIQRLLHAPGADAEA